MIKRLPPPGLMELPTNPRIQPMSRPSGLIFYWEYVASTQVDRRSEEILKEAGIRIWKEGK